MITVTTSLFVSCLSLFLVLVSTWILLPKVSYEICKRACERQSLSTPSKRAFTALSPRMIIGILICFVGVFGITQNQTVIVIVSECACVFVMGVGIQCDLACRLIPRETSILLAILGFIGQALQTGTAELITSYFAGFVLITACCLLAEWLSPRDEIVIGGGDIRCMFALVLATGSNVFTGALACYLLAAGTSLAGIVKGAFSLRTRLCFAPFFMVWLIIGLL